MLKGRGLGAKLAALFSRAGKDEVFFEELEDLLVEGDVGASFAMKAVDELRERARLEKLATQAQYIGVLKRILAAPVRDLPLYPKSGTLNLFLILGVNGVGKTTTIAKMAHHYKSHNPEISMLFCAADTFRAAAAEQLTVLADRQAIRTVSQSQGADPGAVVFDAIASARAEKIDLVFADTAGRMHTKTDLVKELSKIDRIINDRLEEDVYRKILVVDATTGQNALHQVEVFHEAVGVDGIILAKYDSTAKGGMVLAICERTGIPICFVGTGEKMEDLAPFETEKFLSDLMEAT